MAEIDRPAGRFLDQSANVPLDLRRGKWKSLVGSGRRHAERRRSTATEISENRRGQRGEIMRPPAGHRIVCNPEDARQPRVHLRPRRFRAQLDLQPSHARSKRADVQARERRFQIPEQDLDEPGAVLPLQRQLFVMNDDASHRSGNRVIG